MQTPPDGLIIVTHKEFFAALYADDRDIMPSIDQSPYYTTWETKSRYVWGWSSPGWKNHGFTAEIWAIVPDALRRTL